MSLPHGKNGQIADYLGVPTWSVAMILGHIPTEVREAAATLFAAAQGTQADLAAAYTQLLTTDTDTAGAVRDCGILDLVGGEYAITTFGELVSAVHTTTDEDLAFYNQGN